MMVTLVDRVKEALEQQEFRVNGGHLSAQNIRALLYDFNAKLDCQLASKEITTGLRMGQCGRILCIASSKYYGGRDDALQSSG